MTTRRQIPKYRLHKGTGQALVQIAGKRIYLGKYGTPESHEKYERTLAEWLTASRKPAGSNHQDTPGFGPSVNELLLRYWQFAKNYYVKDGRPTKELTSMREALRPVRQLYGNTDAREFGPLALKAVRQHMIDSELSRGVINNRVNRIKRFFKWAASEELVPISVYEALRTVSGLRYGRTTARETEPVLPAPQDSVDAVLPFLAPPIAAMVQLQRLTGMRSGEIVIMRPCDIDCNGDVWLYRPTDHKTRWRGHDKVVAIGPKAQAVIAPFLNRDPQSYMFSPKEAQRWHYEKRPVHSKQERKTPVYPSELRSRKRRKQERRARKKNRVRDHYDTASYRRAIQYGFKRARRAGVEIQHWHPHQLRHSRATEVRKKFGIEAAQVVLGHKRADVTQVYAETNQALALDVAKSTG